MIATNCWRTTRRVASILVMRMKPPGIRCPEARRQHVCGSLWRRHAKITDDLLWSRRRAISLGFRLSRFLKNGLPE